MHRFNRYTFVTFERIQQSMMKATTRNGQQNPRGEATDQAEPVRTKLVFR